MKKILIIEDEKVLLDVLQKKLVIQGYEVWIAQDGEEGIKIIQEIKPDLILLDIIMPKKDGFGVLEEISKNKDLAQIPVIIISNSGQPVEIDKALRMGVKDYLIKTQFSPDEVIAKVTKIFGEDLASQKEVIYEKENKDNNSVASKGNSKILIVEDDKFLRDLITKKLKSEDYQTVVAVDGEEALKKIKEEKPDLILLDLILPGIDGFEVLKRTKNDIAENIRQIPVIILSNLGQKDDVEKGINLGAADFLIKAHFTPGEIVDKIRGVLSGKK